MKEIGPSLDLKPRRIHIANDSLYKSACRKPKQLLDKKEKNIEYNGLGERKGRIHMQKQNINTIALQPFRVNLVNLENIG